MEDLELLTEYHLQPTAHQYVHSIVRVEPRVYEILRAYHWPGNVRELRNMVERCYAIQEDGRISSLFPLRPGQNKYRAHWELQPDQRLDAILDDVERDVIQTAIRRNGGNLRRTAEELGHPPGFTLLQENGKRTGSHGESAQQL